MSAFFWLAHPESDTLYGFFIGNMVLRVGNPKPMKHWVLHLYESEKGRKQGMLRQAREYPGGDILTFEITVAELFKRAKLVPIIPKELYIEGDVDLFLHEKGRRHKHKED